MADSIKLLRDVFISIGVFVPLIDHIHGLLQTYAGSVNVFILPHSEQLTLLALTLVPLLVLRLVYSPNCWIRQTAATEKADETDPHNH
jgi:hypothetical protein